MAYRHVSLPKLFASGDVAEWFMRFDICGRANEWDDATMALKLPTLLEGEALANWLGLSANDQGDYKIAKEKLTRKMTPLVFISLEDFHRRRLRPGEALSVFVHDTKKLLDQAMPGLDGSARDQLLLHQFIAGLPETVSQQIRASGEVKELETAVERAQILMAVNEHHPSDSQAAAKA